MLNGIWVVMVLVAWVVGTAQGTLGAVSASIVDSAKGAVDLALNLVGVMALFLGLMRVAQEGGLLRALARWLRPVMVRLFPDVPPDHPAMSMMILNIAANVMGLGNAATPFGLKAMMELDALNRERGTATPAMALFLAINTSSVTLLPTGMISLRASLDSGSPAAIVVPTILATLLSTTVAIFACKSLQRLWPATPTIPPQTPMPLAASSTTDAENAADREVDAQEALAASTTARPLWWSLGLAGLAVGVVIWGLLREAQPTAEHGWQWGQAWALLGKDWLLTLLVVAFVLFGVARGVKVYDAVVTGAKEGFEVALRIIPYLVAILVAVGMLRASGATGMMVSGLSSLTAAIGMPAEVLPMAILRPLSGSGAYGVATEIMRSQGPDSLAGLMASTMQGSTETTFYVLALYFGAVGVTRAKHTIVACLLADTAGVLASVWAVLWFLG